MTSSESKAAVYVGQAAQCDLPTYPDSVQFMWMSEVCMMILAALAYLLFFMDLTKPLSAAKPRKRHFQKLEEIATMFEDQSDGLVNAVEEDLAVEHESDSAQVTQETACAADSEIAAALPSPSTTSSSCETPETPILTDDKLKRSEDDDDDEDELATAAPSVATSSASWESLDLSEDSALSTPSSASSSPSSASLPAHRIETFKALLSDIAEQVGAGELGLEDAVAMVRMETVLLPDGAGYTPFRGLTRQTLAEAPASERRSRMARLMPAIIDAGLVTYPGTVV